MQDNPIFIFSAGWRSGSTLLQRLITDSGDALIWGETGGGLNCFEEILDRYHQMLGPGDQKYRFGYGGNGSEQFKKFLASGNDKTHRWIASMNPPGEKIEEAMIKFLSTLYADPAKKLGYGRWGVKEVQSGIQTADFIKSIFPEAKFIFLIRNPFSCMLSIKRRNWMDAVNQRDPLSYYLHIWKKLAIEFKKANYGLLVRFEDLVSSQYDFSKMEDYLEISSISRGFIAKSHADWKQLNEENLTFFEKMKIRRILSGNMKLLGY